MAKILIIDDDRRASALFGRILSAAGHQVTLAADGDEGLAAFDGSPAEIVITDLLMPGTEGIETIRELRRRDPRLPIIAISGGGSLDKTDLLNLAERFGANWTLAKPLESKDLVDAVAALLSAA